MGYSCAGVLWVNNKMMTNEERKKLEEQYFGNPDRYYDRTPPYVYEMTKEELEQAIAEEEAKLRELKE